LAVWDASLCIGGLRTHPSKDREKLLMPAKPMTIDGAADRNWPDQRGRSALLARNGRRWRDVHDDGQS
jgi:hypothetical protein